jgi:hypothetical protein
MEYHAMLAHVVLMAPKVKHQISARSLGDPAPGRGPVDLLAEATRLKFTDSEISELKRLYAADDYNVSAKTPQKSG